ncbi:hypothetical protein RI092_01235 [Lactococcus cremoris]|uniref:hypothetical protein n=1 Tax=Lactococcus lactis subsp. cremoris TaxID=1359 RepID=UPI0028729BFD|nr:hypothetical protein [Lactococcus cremoris]MDR9866445.1 hypothetical protein [Lactococcus cremoris]
MLDFWSNFWGSHQNVSHFSVCGASVQLLRSPFSRKVEFAPHSVQCLASPFNGVEQGVEEVKMPPLLVLIPVHLLIISIPQIWQ